MPRSTTINGYDASHVVSALQKCIRRCEQGGDEWERGAIYWAIELHFSGFGAWCWKRLRIICSEDVGLAWTEGPMVIRALYDNYMEAITAGKTQDGERLFLVHAVMLLCRSEKSRVATSATVVNSREVQRREIPDVAFDRHTAKGKRMGRGWDHFWEEGALLANLAEGHEDENDPYLEEAKAAVTKPVRIGGTGPASPRRRAARGATLASAQGELPVEDE